VLVVPNESMLLGPVFGRHLGELAQSLIEIAADYGVSVEIDTSAHPRPGEDLAGWSALEAIEVFVSGVVARELLRLADGAFDAAVAWVKRHRLDQNEIVVVSIYGPDGDVIKTVYVDVDGEARNRPM
jgi:hypothetical protein